MKQIECKINGKEREFKVDERELARDFLKKELDLTSIKYGCETGKCGACTILVDGRALKSCTMFAPKLDNKEIITVEGLTKQWRNSHPEDDLHPIQKSWKENHAYQCGYCTPGFIMTTVSYLNNVDGEPTEDEIRQAVGGNLCRCTGYEPIVSAVKQSAEEFDTKDSTQMLKGGDD